MLRFRITSAFLLFTFYIGFSQLPSCDIWLFDYAEMNNNIIITNGRNVTARQGYDNQPWFTPDNKSFLFSSDRKKNQVDVYRYEMGSGKTRRVTKTKTSEYSPMYTPDGKFISTVMVEKDSAQRIWKFPLPKGKPSIVMDKIDSIGYYTWINADSLALFVLTKPFSLQIANIHTQIAYTVLKDPGRSFPKLDGQNALMTIEKRSEKNWVFRTLMIRRLRNTSDVPGEDMRPLEGSEDFVLTRRGILMARGSKVYSYFAQDGEDSASWHEVADVSSNGITNITRIAVSPDGKHLALVSNNSK